MLEGSSPQNLLPLFQSSAISESKYQWRTELYNVKRRKQRQRIANGQAQNKEQLENHVR